MDAATALAEFAPVGTPAPVPPPKRWSPALNLAFRFWSIYFGLYVLTTQMLGGLIPFLNFNPGWAGPSRWLVEWVGRSVFGITTLVVTGSGSGDKTYDWLHVFTYLVIAAILTVAWSIALRLRSGQARRLHPGQPARVEHHETAHKWFRLFLRFAVGTTMLSYGAAKFVPLQMPFPFLTRLLEPYGHFSPMGVLWASIGASPSYEIATGCVEAAAAVLLMIPRTTTLGALLALMASVQIFTLNMTYDVPVKLFSFHLVLMSLYLLAPDAKRLLDVMLWNRATGPSSLPGLFGSARANRRAAVAQVVVAIALLGSAIDESRSAWAQYGGGAPKSPLYGIWTVAYMAIDGVERPALVTDDERWRRVIFDQPTAMAFQRMDDTFVRHQVKIDTAAKSVAMTRAGDPGWKASLVYEQAVPNRLRLAGEIDGRKIDMRIELLPRESFLLVTRGFNWIQEYPFNR